MPSVRLLADTKRAPVTKSLAPLNLLDELMSIQRLMKRPRLQVSLFQ